ncbi:MAG: hypothetical protein DBX59_11025 [Bacillota bacterium]|nr:MAG: hypothetical protein DBX59_11025 [Bacillota bacterium]
MKTQTNQAKNMRVRQQRIFLFAILTVPVLYFLIVYCYVNASSFLMAFRDMDHNWSLDNFQLFFDELLSENGTVGISLRNTAIYFVLGLLFFPTGIVISYFLFKKIIGYRFFRVVFYLPSIISAIVFVTVFKEFIQPTGPIAILFEKIGKPFPASGLLVNEKTATWAIVFYCIWVGFPTNMLMWSGALTRVPRDVFEAACLDGCGTFKELNYIVLPLIFPTISSLLILSFTGFLNAGGPILLFTNGAAQTSTLGFWMFNQVYSNTGGGSGFYGVLSAGGLFFTLIATPVVLFIRWAVERIPAVEY